MSVKILGQVWELDLDPMDKLVLLALVDHADHEGNNIRPGNEILSAKTGLSHQTISAKFKKFIEAGYLKPADSKYGRSKKREFSVDLDGVKKHPYYAEKDERKLQAARTFQSKERCKQPAPLEAERCKLTEQKVQVDREKVQVDAFAYKEVTVIEPSIEPSLSSPASPASPQPDPPKKSRSKENSSQPKGNPVTPFAQVFDQAYCDLYNCPASKHPDFAFINLNKLRKEKGEWFTLEVWQLAVTNYFRSDIGKHTLSQLACDFDAYFRCPLDRYGKPKPVGVAANFSDKTRGNYAVLQELKKENAELVRAYNEANGL